MELETANLLILSRLNTKYKLVYVIKKLQYRYYRSFIPTLFI